MSQKSNSESKEKQVVSQEMDVESPPYNSLPFIYYPKSIYIPCHLWCVPPIDDFHRACYDGYQYALSFVQFLKDYPDDTVETNFLGDIASYIDFQDKSSRKGYWVGFFSYLERLLYEQATTMNFAKEKTRIEEEFEALKES